MNPWIRWMGAVTWNPAPSRPAPWDQIVWAVRNGRAADVAYIHTIDAESVSIQLGLDAGPIAFQKGRWHVGPRVHGGLEPRQVTSLAMPWESSQGPFMPTVVQKRWVPGVYAGLSGEVWFQQRVGLRLAATQRPWGQGLDWTRVNSRTAELMVRF